MTKNRRNTRIKRRGFLGGAAASTGAVMLQSLATGIPAKILLDPLSASAEDLPSGRVLILSSSRSGDPINANVPGTYGAGLQNVVHAPGATMAETPLTLAGAATTAALPWAAEENGGIMRQTDLDRMVFFHHATHTPVHGDMARVQRMMDATEKNDMLISLLAREIAPNLGTVQTEPLSLGANGGELLSYEGRLLSNVAPLSVQQALGGVDGPLKDLTAMRDTQIDRIYDIYRQTGTTKQTQLLDAWVRSRDEVRSISDTLIGKLGEITGNDQLNQVKTAAILAAMKIAPVITVHLDFGGDNHNDAGLANEVTRHLNTLPVLRALLEEIEALQADVLVGSLNVFGRTLKKKGLNGRDHNRDHHCMLLIGSGLRGGIVGGLREEGNDFKAEGIDSATGNADPAGDISFEDSLGAAGKTLGAAMGVDPGRLDEILPPGKIVQSLFT